jgi:hypothetical protein
MERRINKRIDQYVHLIKNNIVEKVQSMSSYKENQADMLDLLNYIYQYEKFELTKEDFLKRKRVKTMIPMYERCCAKRANGEQCTRRKKIDEQYCGTHNKGTPHGIITDEEPVITTKKIELSAIDIKGIVYYLDNTENVYDTEDVISNIKNPRIIAKYMKNGDEYSIPSLFEDDNN